MDSQNQNNYRFIQKNVEQSLRCSQVIYVESDNPNDQDFNSFDESREEIFSEQKENAINHYQDQNCSNTEIIKILDNLDSDQKLKDDSIDQMQELLIKHKQQNYRRENFEEISADLCKDPITGEWTKWVYERMNEEQIQIFEKIKNDLKYTDPPLDHLTDNHIMRFCNSLQWDYDQILDFLQQAEKLRIEYDCVDMKPEEFQAQIDQKVGRPIFWVRFANWKPELMDERQMLRFICWSLDQCAVNMKPNVDSYIMVYDFKDAGYANFSLSHTQLAFQFLQKVFCDRQYCTCFIRQNWTIMAIQSIVKQFIHPRTALKFRMFGSDWQDQLKQIIPEENLPLEYGGQAENYC